MAETMDLEGSDERYEKEITMKAYASQDGRESLYDWASNVCSLDLTKMEIKEDTDWYAVIETPHKTFRERLFMGDHYSDTLSQVPEAEGPSGETSVSVVKEIETERVRANDPRSAAVGVVKGLLNECPQKLSGGITLNKNWPRYELPNSMATIDFSHFDWNEERVLSKEEKRKNDEMFETLSDVPCLSFMVTMEASSEEYLDAWTEELITELHKQLNTLTGVEKVRYSDCTTAVETKGECYDL